MTVRDNFRTKGATEEGTAEASVLIAGTRYDLPMRKGTLGPDVIDVGTLYQDTGCFTYDPGFTSTASCESKITFIDFDKGIVLYRGYPIEQLAEHSTFLETCYLLRRSADCPAGSDPDAKRLGAGHDDRYGHQLPKRIDPQGNPHHD